MIDQSEDDLSPAYRAKKLRKATNELYDDVDPASALIDLPTDARHFAEAYDLNFAAADRTARAHYAVEIGEAGKAVA